MVGGLAKAQPDPVFIQNSQKIRVRVLGGRVGVRVDKSVTIARWTHQ